MPNGLHNKSALGKKAEKDKSACTTPKSGLHNFKAAENYILSIPRFTAKHSIEETREFLKKIGSPDESMKIIHVAGTNGKGSTCAYLDSILREAGLKTALFTSPHLVDICERFRFDGKDMTHEEFLDTFNEVYSYLEFDETGSPKGYHPTYFEYLFFMAMLWFKRKGAEWCVLETGLGGLLDATNSVTKKEAAVIARIGLDHTEYLGETIPEIAVQKAGIIKEGCPVAFNDYLPEASKVIRAEAEKKASPKILKASPEDISICEKSPAGIDFLMLSGYYKNTDLSLSTDALYQLENASLAVRAIEAAGLCGLVSPEILKRGLKKAFWPGRMEELEPGVFIDGAHNPAGIRAFIESVRADGFEGRRSLLFGVVSDKNFSEMLDMLIGSGLFARLVITPLHSYRSAALSELEGVLDGYEGLKYEIAESPKAGLEGLKSEENGRIYVAGSLYLVGEILSL